MLLLGIGFGFIGLGSDKRVRVSNGHLLLGPAREQVEKVT